MANGGLDRVFQELLEDKEWVAYTKKRSGPVRKRLLEEVRHELLVMEEEVRKLELAVLELMRPPEWSNR